MLSEAQQRGAGDSGNSTSTQQPDLFTLKEKCIKALFMLYIKTQHRYTFTQTQLYRH